MVKSAVVLSEIKENLKDSRFTPALINHLRNQIFFYLCAMQQWALVCLNMKALYGHENEKVYSRVLERN